MPYISPVSKIRQQIRQYSHPISLPTGMTQAQRELVPYVREEQAMRGTRKNWLQPIEAIFDLLQRGQYLTANVAEQLTRNIREGRPVLEGIGREALEGLRGIDKGDWENVLFGGKDVGGEEFEGIFRNIDKERWEKPFLGEKFKGKPIIGATPRGTVGLAANILLDPTTYIGFGPASGARSAASRYADDVARLAIKKLSADPSVLAKLAREGGEELAERVGKMAVENAPEALKLLSKHAGKDMARHMDKVVRAAKKEALRTPEKALKAKTLGDIAELRKPAQEALGAGVQKKVGQIAKELADYGPAPSLKNLIEETVGEYTTRKTATTGLKYLDELAKSVEAGRYGGAGTRAARFMRKEFAVSERYPTAVRAWDNVGKWWREESKLGGVFSDAWWTMMNRGPVGKLKKLFNVRNPYQEILAQMVLDARSATTDSIHRTQKGLVDLLKPLKDDELKAVREVMIQAQGQPADFRALASVMVPPDRVDAVAQTVENINRLTSSWHQRLQGLIEEGIIKDVGEIENYLPIRRTGTGFYKKAPTAISARHPGFLFTRTKGFEENIASEASKLRFVFPEISEEAAARLVSEGAGDIQTDLYQMLLGRAMAQARLEQRATLIKQFREMGFNLKQAAQMDDELAKVMVNNQTVLQQFGLRSVPDDALEGYLFDKEVADILERAIKITENDETLKITQKWANSFTSWWKAWATASPGFHFRNHYSNNITGFLKHGVEWMNPKDNFEAWAGTVYALGRKDAFQQLVKEGVDEATARAVLMRKYGGKSVEELAQIAAHKGVIARSVMGFDAPKTLDDMLKKGDAFKKLNPMSKEFGLLQGSYQLSTYIENVSRFHSFMLDYKKVLKQGASPDSAIEWAKLEAKKWFLDYNDLSQFEQKMLKNIIPFYTWLRKNVANQIQGMFDFREMYAMLPKMHKGKGDVAREDIPEWMIDAGYIPMAESDDKAVMFWPNLPYLDVNKIPFKFVMSEAGIPVPKFDPAETISDIVSSAHPLIKTFTESIGKRDIFLRRELDENLRSPRLLRSLADNPRLLAWLDGFTRSIGFERGLDPDVNEEGQLTINPLMAQALENNVLLLKRLPQYWDMAELIFPALEEAKKKIGAVGDYEKADQQLEEVFQILSFYFGIKFKELDIEEQRGFEAQDIIKAAEKARSKDLKKLPGYQKRRQDYIKSSMIKQKRLGL